MTKEIKTQLINKCKELITSNNKRMILSSAHKFFNKANVSEDNEDKHFLMELYRLLFNKGMML